MLSVYRSNFRIPFPLSHYLLPSAYLQTTTATIIPPIVTAATASFSFFVNAYRPATTASPSLSSTHTQTDKLHSCSLCSRHTTVYPIQVTLINCRSTQFFSFATPTSLLAFFSPLPLQPRKVLKN
jgi:hypothetical protein